MASRVQLKVFLAGRVAVETDGVVVDEGRFPGRQGRLLFAYLVAEQGRPVPRDELAEALWGETPPPSGRCVRKFVPATSPGAALCGAMREKVDGAASLIHSQRGSAFL